MDGSIRRVAPGTPVDNADWHTVCRANTRSAAWPQLAFEGVDAADRPYGYAEATEYTPGRWGLRITCRSACDVDEQLALLTAIAETVSARGGGVIETTIGYTSSVTLDLFRASGMRITSLVSYGGEAALVLRVGGAPHDQPDERASRSVSTSAAPSTIIGK